MGEGAIKATFFRDDIILIDQSRSLSDLVRDMFDNVELHADKNANDEDLFLASSIEEKVIQLKRLGCQRCAPKLAERIVKYNPPKRLYTLN